MDGPWSLKRDGLIVATPIYFVGVTAQTKAWLDRLFLYIGMGLPSKLPSKKASFIFTQNQPNEVLFQVPIGNFHADGRVDRAVCEGLPPDL